MAGSTVIQRAQHPVFFLEVKPAAYLEGDATPGMADDQMHVRFFILRNRVEISVLHAISALGIRLCLYTYTASTSDLEPAAIARLPTRMNDYAPVECWL
ncbi:hypothetical protein BKA93DRAFT_733967 [Sparassis latifolia]